MCYALLNIIFYFLPSWIWWWRALNDWRADWAEVGERGFLVSPGFELCSGLNPMSSYNTPDVDALALHQRGCYMDSENILKFYSNYSVTRCMVECLTRQLIEKCSCRPYYYKGILNIVDNNLVCTYCTYFFHSFIWTWCDSLIAKPFDRVCELEDYICLSTVFGMSVTLRFKKFRIIHRAFKVCDRLLQNLFARA